MTDTATAAVRDAEWSLAELLWALQYHPPEERRLGWEGANVSLRAKWHACAQVILARRDILIPTHEVKALAREWHDTRWAWFEPNQADEHADALEAFAADRPHHPEDPTQ